MNERLVIQSFGPIKYVDIEFRKVTVFMGDQGTGKSCIVKFFSTFKWLEKALIIGKYSLSYFTKSVNTRFRQNLCGYHRIDDFFHEDTYIRYESNLYSFVYSSGAFTVECKESVVTGLPKIVYIPAERAILSSAEKKLKTFDGLPSPSLTFNMLFWDSKEQFKSEGYKLPFGDLVYKYDALSDISWIVGHDYQTRLTNASSGIQSALPICIVSEYLGDIIASGSDRPMSVEDLQKLQEETAKIMENPDLTDTVRNAMLSHISNCSRYSHFVNIVEEPELGLSSESLESVIKLLCRINNSTADNMLLLTTHSSYTLDVLKISHKDCQSNDSGLNTEVISPPEYLITSDYLTAINLTNAGGGEKLV